VYARGWRQRRGDVRRATGAQASERGAQQKAADGGEARERRSDETKSREEREALRDEQRGGRSQRRRGGTVVALLERRLSPRPLYASPLSISSISSLAWN